MTNLIQEVRAALQAATPGTHYIGKQSPNGLQNIGVKGVMTAQVFELGDAVIYANSPAWLQQLIERVETAERQREEAVKALEWYGDEEPYTQKRGWFDDEKKDVYWEAPEILEDRGELARTTLKRIKGENGQ